MRPNLDYLNLNILNILFLLTSRNSGNAEYKWIKYSTFNVITYQCPLEKYSYTSSGFGVTEILFKIPYDPAYPIYM